MQFLAHSQRVNLSVAAVYGQCGDGGILITTTSTLKGLELNFVGAVIHYDLPVSQEEFYIRKSRYDRYNRNLPCKVYLLEDESGTLPIESELIRMYREMELDILNPDFDANAMFKEALNTKSY